MRVITQSCGNPDRGRSVATWRRSPASARSRRRRWWRRWGIRRFSRTAVISPPSWGWCLATRALAAKCGLAASASAGIATCGRYSSTVRARRCAQPRSTNVRLGPCDSPIGEDSTRHASRSRTRTRGGAGRSWPAAKCRKRHRTWTQRLRHMRRTRFPQRFRWDTCGPHAEALWKTLDRNVCRRRCMTQLFFNLPSGARLSVMATR